MISQLGREGLKIPEINPTEVAPGEFLDFFRGVWVKNGTKEVARLNASQVNDGTHHTFSRFLVVPASEDRPLVALHYEYIPNTKPCGRKESHAVMTPPEMVGEFQDLLHFAYDRERLTVFHQSKRHNFRQVTEQIHDERGWENMRGELVGAEDKAWLGGVVADFVEHVS